MEELVNFLKKQRQCKYLLYSVELTRHDTVNIYLSCINRDHKFNRRKIDDKLLGELVDIVIDFSRYEKYIDKQQGKNEKSKKGNKRF